MNQTSSSTPLAFQDNYDRIVQTLKIILAYEDMEMSSSDAAVRRHAAIVMKFVRRELTNEVVDSLLRGDSM